MTRIAITGGIGFIGTEVVSRAIAAGHEVVVVDFLRDKLKYYETNRYPIVDDLYRNLSRAYAVLEPGDFIYKIARFSPQVIVHAGAVVDTTDMGSEQLFDNNIDYTRQLFEQADVLGAHVVFASSAAVYGNHKGHPVNPYALTKAMGENMLSKLKVRTAALRFFNVFGRNEHHKGPMASIPFKLAQCYANGDRFDMHSPDAQRDFVPVTTVARVVLDAANELLGPRVQGLDHLTCDVGTGVATSFYDLDNFVMQATDHRNSIIKMVDMPKHLEGRYQGFTRAGNRGTLVFGAAYGTTRQGIEEAYGRKTA